MELIQFITVAALLLVLLAQGTAGRPDNLTCASCGYHDASNQAYYNDVKKFANELGMLDWKTANGTGKQPYFTKECTRTIWDDDDRKSDSMELNNDRYQFFMDNIIGISCPKKHECVEFMYKKSLVIKGCMPQNPGKCQEKWLVGDKKVKVLCCEDFNMCNSAATFTMNMMIYSAVFLLFHIV
ncbi:uncharacterized protein LOC141914093 [Tubulanus polymorphus]|uniref:uncharacterized protein LOC141914093 n=1 Tax=Tubulanus polymorphus TaxID=672921 RepID=UPI003DA6C92D